jgi:hypothetical protein
MATTLIAKIAARAKVIRAKSPKMTWQSALKKAGAELKGSSVRTTSKRPTVKAKRKPTVKRKSKVGDPIYNAYKRAPITIKKIIDQLGDEPDYDDLKKAAAALKRKGYFMDYGLDAGITALRPIKKTTTKKVGVVAKTKKGAPRKRLSKDQREYNEMTNAYKYFIVITETGRVASGWEYKEDAKDELDDYDGGAKIYTLAQMKKAGIKDPRGEWKYVKVSGTNRPKIEKAAVNMDALNGVIKFAAGKFYEVAAGANKGSVIKITSIRRPTNKKEGSMLYTSYNVDFYEKRNGVLQKPFKGSLTDRWLNKRSIRPRLSVKAHEYKKFI